jgi:hypothetical protein
MSQCECEHCRKLYDPREAYCSCPGAVAAYKALFERLGFKVAEPKV